MAIIKAPFNFVPLNDKVFFPDWADKISQDVPFEDGVSGTVELKITAQTPIFVRNGHTKKDADAKNEKYSSFSRISDNKYFIPATSIKGCIRNVLEIMSFGKMRLDKNAKFAQREWDNPELYSIKTPQVQNAMCCGWLIEDDGKYIIKKCKNLYRINHKRLDEYFKKEIFKAFSKFSELDLNKETTIGNEKYDPKTAVYKYKLLESFGLYTNSLKNISFIRDSKYAVKYKENRVMPSLSDGEFEGTIVLTGQPDKANWNEPRRMNDGKFYEFVFDNEIDGKYEVPVEDFEHYKFIYADSPDWKYAKTKLNSEGIPVFFRLQNGRIKDFGLAFLYKLPYDKSPYETLSSDHKSTDLDMADCIFGYVNGRKALRGRVHFSNAFSDNAIESDSVRLALSSPKASYYPIYIRQQGNNGLVTNYLTYNDSQISGWKRYMVRANAFERNTGDDNIDTIIYPLAYGSTFNCKVRFHNLKPQELGALLSAITFHNTNDCFHQIGQGKPYGFGKVKFDVTKILVENDLVEDCRLYMQKFEGLLYEKYSTSWVNDERIVQLFTMAHVEVTSNDVFDYMKMATKPDDNEFLAAKIAKEYLDVYTRLSQRQYSPASLYEPERERLLKEKERESAEKEYVSLSEKYDKLLSNINVDSLSSVEKCNQALDNIDLAEHLFQDIRQKFPDKELIDKYSDLRELIRNKKGAITTNEGLSFLLKQKVNGNGLLISELSNGVGRINQFLKKFPDFALSDIDKKTIEQWLKTIPKPTKKADLRDYEDINGKSWSRVAELVGSDLATRWFNEIVHQ
jgi:CRISPR-associated protein (TIGR03986 family)